MKCPVSPLRYFGDEGGATAIEYALIVSLIAVMIVGVLGTIGINLRNKANDIADAIADAGSCNSGAGSNTP